MVHERREDDLVRRAREPPPVVGVFGLAVRDLLDHQYKFGHPLADPGCYGATAELGRFVVLGVSGQLGAPRDRNGREWEVWWAIAALRGDHWQWYRGHAIGDPNWVTFYRGAYSQRARVSPLDCDACRSMCQDPREVVVHGLLPM